MEFDNLKDKVLSTLGQTTNIVKDLVGKAGDNAKDITGKTADLAKNGSRIAKLSVDVATERENMRKTFCKIGQLYYETYKNAPEEAFVQLFGEILLAENTVAKKEAEISALKVKFSGNVDTNTPDENEKHTENNDSVICEPVASGSAESTSDNKDE